ncbi:MAG: hypothetical protein QM664_01590 [Flavihumibacter sp.]
MSESTPLPFSSSEGTQSVFVQSDEDPALIFAEAFSSLQGKFAFCLDERELAAQLKALIAERKWESIYVRDRKIRGQLRPWVSRPLCPIAAWTALNTAMFR